MRRAALLVRLVSAVLASGCGVARAEVAAASPADRDEIVERVEIRARGRQHGEVRLVRRGATVVLQTLLVTRTLERVAARIRDKEEEIWPAGRPGHDDSLRYRDALAGAVEQVRTRERTDRHRRLLIELSLGERSSAIVFAAPTTRVVGGRLEIAEVARIRELVPSCAWLRREIALVAADRGLSLAALSPLPSCPAH